MTKAIEELIKDNTWQDISTLQYFDVKNGIAESNLVLLCTHGGIPRIGRQMFNVAGQKPIQWGDSLPDLWRGIPDNRCAEALQVAANRLQELGDDETLQQIEQIAKGER